MKFPPMGVELFHAEGRTEDGQTDITQLIIVFRNFLTVPKIIPRQRVFL
jgi:hypothetical protein